MATYLITGGLGFIGSNFIDYLLATDAEACVVNIDALTYAGNPQNLVHLKGHPRYRFVRGDIADEHAVAELFASEKFTYVLNFAAETMVDRSIVSSAPFIHSIVHGTQVLLDAVLKAGVERYLQVSTDEVYGSLGPSGEFTEESPIQPNNPYSAAKAGADLLCRAYFVTHKLPVVVTRCSNNYGPRQFPEKAIPLFIQRALHDESIPVYGDGLNVRDWLHVEDHCSGILSALHGGDIGEAYNIGGGTELPNIELVKILLAELGKPESLISFVEDRPGHDRRYALCHDKLTAQTGWQPEVVFADGLRRTVDWYISNGAWLEAIREGTYQSGS